MKVRTSEGVRDYRTIWIEDEVVRMIDQRTLPLEFAIYDSGDYQETIRCIRDMVVRGAPAIGAAAAYSYAQAVLSFDAGKSIDSLREYMRGVEIEIKGARPTAYDLFHAAGYMAESLRDASSVGDAREIAVAACSAYAEASVDACRRIGLSGKELIKDGCGVLTHCNAGALACVDHGTALAPVRFAHDEGRDMHVYVDETRPRLQGARLTAWELAQESIHHSLIVDNAAGYFMQQGVIDVVIVGADRITCEGDVINKIGTYEKAVVARENGIPFYVAAPKTTFDKYLKSREVEIEERAGTEVTEIDGIRIAPAGTLARNPSFDITPRRYVSGIITEDGIVR